MRAVRFGGLIFKPEGARKESDKNRNMLFIGEQLGLFQHIATSDDASVLMRTTDSCRWLKPSEVGPWLVGMFDAAGANAALVEGIAGMEPRVKQRKGVGETGP